MVREEWAKVHKTPVQMDREDQGNDSTEVWKGNLLHKYRRHPADMETACLAEVAANYCVVGKKYKHRQQSVVIRYCNYSQKNLPHFKKEHVLLYDPFHSKEQDAMNDDQFLCTRKFQFDRKLDIENISRICMEMLNVNEDYVNTQQQCFAVIHEEMFNVEEEPQPQQDERGLPDEGKGMCCSYGE